MKAPESPYLKTLSEANLSYRDLPSVVSDRPSSSFPSEVSPQPRSSSLGKRRWRGEDDEDDGNGRHGRDRATRRHLQVRPHPLRYPSPLWRKKNSVASGHFGAPRSSEAHPLPISGLCDNPNIQAPRWTARYCTKNCLLGLKLGRDLDPRCPNVAAHRSAASYPLQHSSRSETHHIALGQLDKLVCQQLLRNRGRLSLPY